VAVPLTRSGSIRGIATVGLGVSRAAWADGQMGSVSHGQHGQMGSGVSGSMGSTWIRGRVDG